MNRGLLLFAAPVVPAVEKPLDERPDCPKESNSGGEPTGHFVFRVRDVSGEADRDDSKNQEDDADEPFVNDEDFLKQFGNAFEVFVPAQHFVETHVDAGDDELSDGSGDEDFVQVIEDEAHGLLVVVWVWFFVLEKVAQGGFEMRKFEIEIREAFGNAAPTGKSNHGIAS